MNNQKVAQELATVAKLLTGKYPPRAMDYNKVKNSDGFWEWEVREASRQSAMTFRPKDVGDVLFWLNMVADRWEALQRQN